MKVLSTKGVRLLLAAAIVACAARTADAGPIGFDIWYEFGFGGPGSAATGCAGGGCVPSSGTPTVFADDPPWTYASAAPSTFTITDAFLRGDSFSVFDFGVLVGATPVVAPVGACGDDPVPCLADPLVSHAVFALAPGAHSITIVADTSPFGGGAAYFKADTRAVPEPGALFILGAGLAGLGLVSRRKRS